jgi:hypothetical protein
MIVLGLTGHMGSGKDTVADHLVAEHGFTKMSFAQPLKDMVLKLNPYVDREGTRLSHVTADAGHEWERVLKEHFPEYRRLLQVLGTDCIRAIDPIFWVNAAWQKLQLLPADARVVFSDVRFPNEASFIQILVAPRGPHGQYPTTAVWEVIRPGHAGDAHSSEQFAGKMHEDRVVGNAGDISDLHKVVDFLIEDLIEEEDVRLTA